MNRQTLCIDFDGVIHSYENGWKDGSIYGTIVPGFEDWAHEVAKEFDLVIYSSRSKTPSGRAAMKRWLTRNWKGPPIPKFEFASTKPPAWLTIDDRCIRFQGRWEWIRLDVLKEFRPWNDKRGGSNAPDSHPDE
jgi:hypothetical protein